MTADTFSNTLGFLLMGTGNDNNSWGSNANTSIFQILEDAIANALTSTVTGGTLDLSGSPPPAAASQVRHARLVFNGTLSSDQTVKVPNLSKTWWVENFTSGAFVLIIQSAAGGTGTQIPKGTSKFVRCDPNQAPLIRRMDADEIGRLEDYGVTSVPAGMLACDGGAYSRTRFPDLFAKIGTTWGLGTGGDVTTFGVPNLMDTGRFKRASAGFSGIGTYQANQNLSHTHVVVGTTDTEGQPHTHTQQGTFTSGTESAAHTHTYNPGVGSSFQSGTSGGSLAVTGTGQTSTESAAHTHSVTISGQTSSENGAHSHTFSTTSNVSGGGEARPESVIVLCCIRY